jgi:hypothetical protein
MELLGEISANLMLQETKDLTKEQMRLRIEMLIQNGSLHFYFTRDWFVYYLTTVYLASNEAEAEMERSKILKHKKICSFLDSTTLEQ